MIFPDAYKISLRMADLLLAKGKVKKTSINTEKTAVTWSKIEGTKQN